MSKTTEYLVDDTPLDMERFMKEHTKEEIESMYQEYFGVEQNKKQESED